MITQEQIEEMLERCHALLIYYQTQKPIGQMISDKDYLVAEHYTEVLHITYTLIKMHLRLADGSLRIMRVHGKDYEPSQLFGVFSAEIQHWENRKGEVC